MLRLFVTPKKWQQSETLRCNSLETFKLIKFCPHEPPWNHALSKALPENACQMATVHFLQKHCHWTQSCDLIARPDPLPRSRQGRIWVLAGFCSKKKSNQVFYVSWICDSKRFREKTSKKQNSLWHFPAFFQLPSYMSSHIILHDFHIFDAWARSPMLPNFSGKKPENLAMLLLPLLLKHCCGNQILAYTLCHLLVAGLENFSLVAWALSWF